MDEKARSFDMSNEQDGTMRAGVYKCKGWVMSRTSRLVFLCGSLIAVGIAVPAGVHSFRKFRRSGPAPGSDEAIARAKALLPKADAAFFDVDSTVVKTEGIDIMGTCFGVGKQIAELTRNAMGGSMKFQDALAQRLDLMGEHGMTRAGLEKCVKNHGQPQWSPKIREVIKAFHDQGTVVYLVSGGFVNMLNPLAKELNIPYENVYGNEILFDEKGAYSGFNKNAPTCSSGGKPKVLSMMKRKHGYKTMFMFGDGATDLEARTQGPASVFIGYGGMQVREKVKKGSDWFVKSFSEVLDVLKEEKVVVA